MTTRGFRVPARAALAGNPSDGFGGAVLAVPVPALFAQASYEPDEPPDPTEIVAATVSVFDRRFSTKSKGRLRCSANIPLQVGLGGSSAISVACIQALADHHSVSVSPLDIARLALVVEVEEMGIAAGMQDRITQAFDEPMFM